ncbi:MAG TPA: magnesium transporter [Burkholderiales bacterium]|nr:magnesium transporter [Burkholderiales bacterium]
MAELERLSDSDDLQRELQRVAHLLEKQKVVEELVHRQEMPRHDLVESLVHKQHLAELQRILDQLHPADVAYILEALPLADRLTVWNLVKAERDGEILLEVSDAVRESLIADMEPKELVAAAENLDTDEIADLAPDLPQEVIQDVFRRLSAEERDQLRAALAHEEGTVGALMDFDMVTIREDVTLEVVLRYLRRMDELPDHFDKLFVVDREGRLQGELPLNRLLLHDPEAMVAAVMDDDPVSFVPTDDAGEAAQAFERYDLVSAPVIDADGLLVARLTVDNVVDFIREESSAEVLSLGGLKAEEDIFAPVWKSLRNRWTWLGVNLVTAFIASRVIGVFEDSIEKLAALAALMPIIAGIGGNSGNQTITMIVRALALGQITLANAKQLFAKEIWISLLNGLVWGSLVGLFAFVIYHSVSLGLVMSLALTLNLVLAAVVGVMIPLVLYRLGRDPASGSSVLITAVTDSGGFFIFLGLATLFMPYLGRT